MSTYRKHLYRPIAYYNGAVLKYAGLSDTPEHTAFYVKHWTENPDRYSLPGCVVLSEYHGDRIKADTRELFTDI